MPRMSQKVACAFGIVTVVLSATGCYTFAPTELGQVVEGVSVRMLLTRDGLDRVRELGEPALEALDRPVVSGVFVHNRSGGVTLRVPVMSRDTGFLMSVLEQQVTLPESAVIMVESRRFSRGRTALLAVGAGALAGFVVHAILGKAIHPTGPGQPTYPQDSRLPIVGP